MATMLAVSAMADTPSGSDKAFCFAQKTPMTFQWFETAVHKHFIADWKGFPDFVRSWDRKSLFEGGEDFMLDHLQGMPDPSEMTEPVIDEDAIALQAKLRELATRPVEDLNSAIILATIPAYGVGSTVSSLVYPVLEALAQDATLFAPSMLNWTSPSCAARDLSCYFDSLPSLKEHRSVKAHSMSARARGTEHLLARLHTPLHNDTTDSLCDAVKGLGIGCPQLLRGHATVQSESLDVGPKGSSRHHATQAVLLPQLSSEQKAQVEQTNPKDLAFAKTFDAALRVLKNDHDNAVHQEELKPELATRAAKVWEEPLGIAKGHFDIGKTGVGLASFFGATQYNERSLPSRLPKRFLKRGRFWLMSQVIHFLTTPNAKLKARLDIERASLQPMERPVLGLHVRKGDACGDRGECRDLKDYMPTINDMINKYGYKTVFLATPDGSVLDDVDDFPDVTFKYLPVTNTTEIMKQQNFRKIDDAIAAGVVDAGTEFEEAMVSAYLLSEADGFVGGFSSNAARIAYSMMAAGPKGCLKPFDSFDINWCSAFGKGGPAVLRRGSESCHDVQAKGMKTLPCMISC